MQEGPDRDAAIERMLPRTLKLAHLIIFKRRFYHDREEILSAAQLGLLKAVIRFDPQRNDDLWAFALRYIRGAIADVLRTHPFMAYSRSGVPRIRLVSLDTSFGIDSEARSVLDFANLADPPRFDVKIEADDLMSHLNSRERMVLHRFYWEGACLREIGRELGVNESRACQLRNRAVERLAEIPWPTQNK